MNSQELFTIDEATGEIIPISQTSQIVQPPTVQSPQFIQQNEQSSQFVNQSRNNLPLRNTQSQPQYTNQIRNNNVPRPQFQSNVQTQQQKVQPVQQAQSIPVNQQSVPYKNWKNSNMNNFKMVQPNNTFQTSSVISPQTKQQPLSNQISQFNTQTVSQNVSQMQQYQYDENNFVEQPQQSNRLRHGSFISKTNVPNNYNITSLPKQGSLAIRKARTGKNSEDIYL